MFQATVSFFDSLMRRYTPDPYILALLITLIVYVTGLIATPAGPQDMVRYWGEGFWNLIPFTLQMAMVLIGGYVVALSPPVHKLLQKLAALPKTNGQAVILTTLVATLGSYLNWGLGLVVGGLVCREIVERKPEVNFRLLVASAYSGFLVWHGGLSGSVPLMLATPGNFAEQWVGEIVSVEQTMFAPFNLLLVGGLFILLPLTNWLLSRLEMNNGKVELSKYHHQEHFKPSCPAEHLENTSIIPFTIGTLGLAYVFIQVNAGTFRFDINTVNFVFLFTAILFHMRSRPFLNAIGNAATKVGPILIQFPFYAGIMGMIASSKLVHIIAQWFVDHASVKTFPLLTFYSAGLINLFVPSGGGQWAVQAPVVVQAANDLGVDIAVASMAVAWGDAWTNMLQPFWALPLLAIAGLKLRDIMGYCVTILIVSGIFLSVVFACL